MTLSVIFESLSLRLKVLKTETFFSSREKKPVNIFSSKSCCQNEAAASGAGLRRYGSDAADEETRRRPDTTGINFTLNRTASVRVGALVSSQALLQIPLPKKLH